MEGQPPPVEERRRLREELNEFVESCCRTLEEVTASLGWSLDRLDPGEQGAEEVRGAGVRGPFGALACPHHGLLWRRRAARGPRKEGRGGPGHPPSPAVAGDRTWSAPDASPPGLRLPRPRNAAHPRPVPHASC